MRPLKSILAITGIFLLAGCSFSDSLNFSNDSGTENSVADSTGVTDDQIVIGSSAALTGHAGYLGESYTKGALARINEINEEGGINGRKIKLVSYDDKYDPALCISNTDKLIKEDKVFALFNYVGTPTTVQALPLIEVSNVPLVGIFSGANSLRAPLKKNVFNIRASYYEEVELAVENLVDKKGLKKVAVFFQADAYGMDGLEGTRIALKKRNIDLVAQASYIRGTVDVEPAVETITAAGAEVVIMVGTYSPSAKFVKLAKEKNSALVFSSVSFVGPEEFLEELGETSEGVYVTQVVPTLDSAALLEGVAMYKESLAKYFPEVEPSLGGLEGYVNARVLINGLRLSGRDLTREKFVSSLESMDNFSAGIGQAASFSPENHQGLDHPYLTVIKNGKFELVF
jgi:ABC-type branched-subunit amino acid transport system substrate-binding protein